MGLTRHTRQQPTAGRSATQQLVKWTKHVRMIRHLFSAQPPENYGTEPFKGGSGHRAEAYTRPVLPKIPSVLSAFSLIGSPQASGSKSLGRWPPWGWRIPPVLTQHPTETRWPKHGWPIRAPNNWRGVPNTWVWSVIYHAPHERIWHKAVFTVGPVAWPKPTCVRLAKNTLAPSVFPLLRAPQAPGNKPFEKSNDCYYKQFISIQNNKVLSFSFKIIPVESNGFSLLLFPRFYALLKGFFRDAPKLHDYSPSNALHTFKTGFLDYFEFKENKNLTRIEIRGTVMPNAHGVLRCCVESATFCSVTTLVSINVWG